VALCPAGGRALAGRRREVNDPDIVALPHRIMIRDLHRIIKREPLSTRFDNGRDCAGADAPWTHIENHDDVPHQVTSGFV
jgi:hypothetical protein